MPASKTTEKNGPWKPDYSAPRGTAARHAEAYRERAGLVGRLLMCICTYPLDKEPTRTGHSEFCPAEMAAKLAEPIADQTEAV